MLVPQIFRCIPPQEQAPVFADAFLGGGSVSMFAKAKGYRVIANDLAERSYIVGKALVENSETKLNKEDIVRLFQPIKTDRFVTGNYVGKMFNTKSAEFIDNFRAHIGKTEHETKRYLLQLLLMKYCIILRPFGLFTSIKDIGLLERNEIEKALSHKSNRGRTINQIKNPLPILLHLKNQINNGVFSNGLSNQIHQGDVFDFIQKTKADIVYFDPPYSQSASYEETYKVLDSIVAGRLSKPNVSVFTKTDALKFQDDLYRRSDHIKHWVISMGQTATGTGISPEELLEVVKRYRPKAEVKILDHRWVINNSTKKNQKDNIEYLIHTFK